MDVGSAVGRYLKIRRDTGELARSTVYQQRYRLVEFARAHDFELDKLRRSHIEKWLGGLNVADSTRVTYFQVVRTFLRWSVERGWIATDPTRGIRLRTPAQGPARNLAPEEVAALLEVVPDERARVIVLLMVQDCLRRSEVSKLCVEEIDKRGGVMLVHGKGSKQRVVPISDETLEAIATYLAKFPNPRGPLVRSYSHPRMPISGSQIGNLMSEWMYAAGVKRAAWDGRSPHALRHTGAGDLLESGADIGQVQEILGHASLSTTNTYTKRLRAKSQLREVANRRRYGVAPLDGAA